MIANKGCNTHGKISTVMDERTGKWFCMKCRYPNEFNNEEVEN